MEQPEYFLHGTATGIVELALRNDGILSPGYNPRSGEGRALFLMHPENRSSAAIRAERIAKLESFNKHDINEALLDEGLGIGQPVVLQLSGLKSPIWEWRDDYPQHFYTNNRVTLDQVTAMTRDELVATIGKSAENYFTDHLLRTATPEIMHRTTFMDALGWLSVIRPTQALIVIEYLRSQAGNDTSQLMALSNLKRIYQGRAARVTLRS